MDEAVFAMMQQGDSDVEDAAWVPGFWAHMVRVVHIYAQIQEFYKASSTHRNGMRS